MTYQEAKDKYIELFGGFPEFLFMTADESYILPYILKALETGEEIGPPELDVVY